MLCSKCRKGKLVDKLNSPYYCGGCGFGFLTNPKGEPTDVTCLQALTYGLAVERGLIKDPGFKPEVAATSKKEVIPVEVEPKAEEAQAKAEIKPEIKMEAKPASNTEKVFEVIKKFGPIGKAEILSKSGINETEYKDIISALLSKGRIIQEGAKRGTKYRVKI